MDRVGVSGLAQRLLQQQSLVKDSADRTGMRSGRSFQSEQGTEERPVSVEQCRSGIEEALQDGEDVWAASGVAGERSVVRCRQPIQLLPSITALVHQQGSKVLHSLERIRHSQLRVPSTAIPSHCNEGSLCTQNR